MIKRIMVGLSGTPHTPIAVATGCELAKRFDAGLTGMTFIDQKAMLAPEAVPIGEMGHAKGAVENRLAAARERVQAVSKLFESACTEHNLPFQTVVRDGDPIDLLVDEWRYHDLTIFGLKGLFEYGLVREPVGVLNHLIACGIRPILAVPDQHREIKRVLVANNGSTISAKVLKRFVQMNLFPGCELELVRFIADDSELLRNDATRSLERSAAYCQAHEFTVASCSVLTGDPSRGLVAEAERRDCDLIVLGDSGRNRIARRLLGDTALHVVTHSDRYLYLSH